MTCLKLRCTCSYLRQICWVKKLFDARPSQVPGHNVSQKKDIFNFSETFKPLTKLIFSEVLGWNEIKLQKKAKGSNEAKELKRKNAKQNFDARNSSEALEVLLIHLWILVLTSMNSTSWFDMTGNIDSQMALIGSPVMKTSLSWKGSKFLPFASLISIGVRKTYIKWSQVDWNCQIQT